MQALPEIEIGQTWALPPVEGAGLLGTACAEFYRHQLRLMVRRDGDFARWSAATSAALRAFYRVEDVSETTFRGWLERVFIRAYDETPLEYVRRLAVPA